MVIDKKKNIAFIGFGVFAQKRYQALQTERGVRVIGFFDPDAGIIPPTGLIRYQNLDELLQGQSDIVIISTPHYLHWELIKRCYKAKKFPFCEKPFVITSYDLNESIKNPNIAFYMSSNLMHFPSFRIASKFIRHFIDEIHQIEFSIGVFSPHPDSWRYNTKQSGGGSLIDNGVHLYRFFNQNFKKLTIEKSAFTFRAGIEMESFISGRSDNIKVSFKTSWLQNLNGYSQIKIRTKNKSYLFFASQDEIHILNDQEVIIKSKKIRSSSHSLQNEFQYFLHLVSSHQLISQDMERAQRTMAIILKGIESAKEQASMDNT